MAMAIAINLWFLILEETKSDPHEPVRQQVLYQQRRRFEPIP